MRTLPLLAASALALTCVPSAQAPALDKLGGANPGPTTIQLEGTPGQIYALLFAFNESATTLPTGATLAIPLDYLSFTFTFPGFVGLVNGLGKAQASFALSGDPALTGITISFQAVQGPNFDAASNLLRVTPSAPGSFTNSLDAPDLPIAGGTVAPTADGRVLLIGGTGPVAQVYDPRTEEFELGGATFGVGILAQATTLADGRVLFTGGIGLDGQPTDAAALYDPATESTTTLAMNAKRAGHGAALLGNGKVLITGGFSAFDLTDILGFLTSVQASTELFDPSTQSFSAGPNMLEARALHSETSLNDGGALVAGGLSVIPIVNIPNVSSTAYQYNATLNTFGLPKFMGSARMLHSAVKLDNGKVLIAGGVTLDLTQFIATGDLTQIQVGTLSDCQVYTPGFFSGFATVNGMASGRAGAGIVALPGGKALIAGGAEISIDPANPTGIVLGTLATADLFSSNALSPTGALTAARFLPVLTTLHDGNVLVVGGGPTTAELYQP